MDLPTTPLPDATATECLMPGMPGEKGWRPAGPAAYDRQHCHARLRARKAIYARLTKEP